ncbi:hypothetical protein BDN72DRAFT_848448 [Pluteus cervinus]|uniref:Uncharacterized protein n=1 Tax=Pluteus cervinus TaxID=181527 RepID=A0ACD3A9U2_9AGAR|nr:hypothetical protein BDN72DRAFT_848448 [Pluteus cervinus]
MELEGTPTANTAPSLSASECADFIHKLKRYTGQSESEIIKFFREGPYGSLAASRPEYQKLIEIEQQLDAVDKRAREMCPNPTQLGRKPRPGDDVTIAILSPNLKIRVYSGPEMVPLGMFSFDFVDENDNYIATPSDIKIFSTGSGSTPPGPVYSIEKYMALQDPRNSSNSIRNFRVDKSKMDPNWETYAVQEGVQLLIRIVLFKSQPTNARIL